MEKKKTTEETEPELTSWMEGTVHRCLLCLGGFITNKGGEMNLQRLLNKSWAGFKEARETEEVSNMASSFMQLVNVVLGGTHQEGVTFACQ